MGDKKNQQFLDRVEALHVTVKEHFGDLLESSALYVGDITLEVLPQNLINVMEVLRDDPAFKFSQLIDLCGVDYAAYGQSEWEIDGALNEGFSRGTSDVGLSEGQERRFAVVYHLLSVSLNQRIRIKVFVDSETLAVDSVVPVWPGANWFEREAFDLFGILFTGHPDLRRILTDYGFVGFPFRKDFPLIGHVEMRYDEDRGRVIYEPVSIEPRVLVPKVIRNDHRYVNDEENVDNV